MPTVPGQQEFRRKRARVERENKVPLCAVTWAWTITGPGLDSERDNNSAVQRSVQEEKIGRNGFIHPRHPSSRVNTEAFDCRCQVTGCHWRPFGKWHLQHSLCSQSATPISPATACYNALLAGWICNTLPAWQKQDMYVQPVAAAVGLQL